MNPAVDARQYPKPTVDVSRSQAREDGAVLPAFRRQGSSKNLSALSQAQRREAQSQELLTLMNEVAAARCPAAEAWTCLMATIKEMQLEMSKAPPQSRHTALS